LTRTKSDENARNRECCVADRYARYRPGYAAAWCQLQC
jgi:hypothetical protein